MDFKELDAEMRQYKKDNAQVIPEGMYIVAHLDGHKFSSLTRKYFNPPFDEKFHEMMCSTAKSLMDCGFRIVYAYTQSDEISLLFDINEDTFGRRTRKYDSILAGKASAHFSFMFGREAVFDCCVFAFADKEMVRKYFLWRMLDAQRNSLNMCCYWALRKEGMTERGATRELKEKSVQYKKDMLSGRGIRFDMLPEWQRQGISFKKGTYMKKGYNPLTKETVMVTRNTIIECANMPEDIL